MITTQQRDNMKLLVEKLILAELVCGYPKEVKHSKSKVAERRSAFETYLDSITEKE